MLQHRVAKVAKMQKDALAQQSVASACAIEMRKRHEEVHSLKSSLLQLKREVLNAFVKPTSPSPAAPVELDHSISDNGATNEKPKRASTTSIAVQVNVTATAKPLETVVVQTAGAAGAPLAMPLALKGIASQTVQPVKRAATAKPDSVPALVSRPVKMVDLMGGQEDSDELSTSQSYRLLLATS